MACEKCVTRGMIGSLLFLLMTSRTLKTQKSVPHWLTSSGELSCFEWVTSIMCRLVPFWKFVCHTKILEQLETLFRRWVIPNGRSTCDQIQRITNHVRQNQRYNLGVVDEHVWKWLFRHIALTCVNSTCTVEPVLLSHWIIWPPPFNDYVSKQ